VAEPDCRADFVISARVERSCLEQPQREGTYELCGLHRTDTVVREQRPQETVDALERERLLGRHRPAPYIGSQSLEPHLGPACKAAQPLVTTRPSGNPARTVAGPPTLSVIEAE